MLYLRLLQQLIAVSNLPLTNHSYHYLHLLRLRNLPSPMPSLPRADFDKCKVKGDVRLQKIGSQIGFAVSRVVSS